LPSEYVLPVGLHLDAPAPPELAEGYEVRWRDEDDPPHYFFYAQVSVLRVERLLTAALALMPARCHAVLELRRCDERMEQEPDGPAQDRFVSALVPRAQVAAVLDRYRFQILHDGMAGFGFYDPDSPLEVFLDDHKLLSLFAPVSMTVATGSSDGDAQAGHRRDVCHFSDDRLSTAQKLDFVHSLLQRDMGEVRMFLDHLEKYSPGLAGTSHAEPAAMQARAEIAADRAARTRYLDFMRDADQMSVRARMIELADRLGWLTPGEKRAEMIAMIDTSLARPSVGAQDVDLVCSLNRDHALDDTLRAIAQVPAARMADVGHAGIVACLGSATGHARVLQAVTSARDDDVQIAQVYLRYRPIVDVSELRLVAASIARMNNQEAQVRALDTLAQHRLTDVQSLDALTHLFPATKSLEVQRAIAGILIRADYRAIAKPELVQALRTHRRKSSDGQDLIDILIRRLQASLPPAA